MSMSGSKGGRTSIASSPSQSIEAKKGCSYTSATPRSPQPHRWLRSRWSSREAKSHASGCGAGGGVRGRGAGGEERGEESAAGVATERRESVG